MQQFRVHILGCGSALPTKRHNPSSQIVEVRGKLFMIDCGEGTQLQLRNSKLNFSKIYAVFISHLHGDHVLGLIGMLSTFGLQGRTAPLHIYAPDGYEQLLRMELAAYCSNLGYEVVFHAVDTQCHQVIYEDRSLTVSSIPLCHRVPCAGFLFREKNNHRHIIREKIDYYHIPVSQINNIKAGADWTDGDGNVIPNDWLTMPADPSRSYAYCSDTKYVPELADLVCGVDLLYHESTYTEENHTLAEQYFHSTAHQAALIARDAHVARLMLGHYSKRYANETPFLDEACQTFPNTILAKEGLVVNV